MWLVAGGPLTQQQLPQGLPCGLPAAGPEVALGIADLEAGLLSDGGGGGTWGKPKPPRWWPLRGRGGGGGPGLRRACLSVRGLPGDESARSGGGGGPPLPLSLPARPERGASVGGGVKAKPGALQPVFRGGGKDSSQPLPHRQSQVSSPPFRKGGGRAEAARRGGGSAGTQATDSLEEPITAPWTKASNHRRSGSHRGCVRHTRVRPRH